MSWLLQILLQWTLGHMSLLIMGFSGYTPRSGIARLDSSAIFSLIMNLPSVFPSGCTNLHSHQLCRSVTFSPHLLQHLLFVDFFTVVILTSVKWYITVVFNCIYLTIRDVEHCFDVIFGLCMSSLEKNLSRSSARFLIGMLLWYCTACAVCIFQR